MSRHAWAFSDRSPGGYYRDRENGWIFGVCAGLAEFANFRVGTVRIITLICLVLFFWPTVFIYAAIAVLVKEKLSSRACLAESARLDSTRLR